MRIESLPSGERHCARFIDKRHHGAGSRENKRNFFRPDNINKSARRNLANVCAAIRKSHAQPFGKTREHADIRFIAIRFLDRENEIIGTDCRRGFKARNAFDARVLTKVHCADFRKVESCAGNSRHLGYRLRFTLTGGRRRNIRRCGCRRRNQYQPGSSTAHEDCAANRFKKMRMRISSLHRPPNRCFAKAGAASRQPAKFSFRERKSLQRILASAASSLYRRRGCQLQRSLREITYTLV